MRLSSLPARCVPALVLACALSACGGGSSSGFSGGLPGTGTAPTAAAAATAPAQTDASAAVVKSCAP